MLKSIEALVYSFNSYYLNTQFYVADQNPKQVILSQVLFPVLFGQTQEDWSLVEDLHHRKCLFCRHLLWRVTLRDHGGMVRESWKTER